MQSQCALSDKDEANAENQMSTCKNPQPKKKGRTNRFLWIPIAKSFVFQHEFPAFQLVSPSISLAILPILHSLELPRPRGVGLAASRSRTTALQTDEGGAQKSTVLGACAHCSSCRASSDWIVLASEAILLRFFSDCVSAAPPLWSPLLTRGCCIKQDDQMGVSLRFSIEPILSGSLCAWWNLVHIRQQRPPEHSP